MKPNRNYAEVIANLPAFTATKVAQPEPAPDAGRLRRLAHTARTGWRRLICAWRGHRWKVLSVRSFQSNDSDLCWLATVRWCERCKRLRGW